MDDIAKSAQQLQNDVFAVAEQLHIASNVQEMDVLITKQQSPEFWDDTTRAQRDMQRLSKLTQKVSPWQKLMAESSELTEMLALEDETIHDDLAEQLQRLSAEFELLKKQLRYSGTYDDYDVIMSIYAGAGGTDAQDWAQMLMRMYLRWAEQQAGVSAQVIQESPGEEAGIKSVTLEITGPLLYGKLKGEHGVHRLVRLSPFNADNLRQTSFAKVDVLPKIDAPDELIIDEKDLKIDVYRAGGHGGQSVNTTDSAVRVTHIPTGLTVAIQNERSQLQNKETALTILRSRLAQLQLEQHKDTLTELKGPNEQAAWGNQIRNYVLHPYSMVKDSRSKYETSDVQKVLDGNLDAFIDSYAQFSIS